MALSAPREAFEWEHRRVRRTAHEDRKTRRSRSRCRAPDRDTATRHPSSGLVFVRPMKHQRVRLSTPGVHGEVPLDRRLKQTEATVAAGLPLLAAP